MNTNAQSNLDNSNKSVLARACDPQATQGFAKIVRPLIGNAEYVASTDDTDFIKKLESQEWSVVFFAPGACRFSAVNRQIPGGNYDTKGWSLEEYKDLVTKLQGQDVIIVETLEERQTVDKLRSALENAKETR